MEKAPRASQLNPEEGQRGKKAAVNHSRKNELSSVILRTRRYSDQNNFKYFGSTRENSNILGIFKS